MDSTSVTSEYQAGVIGFDEDVELAKIIKLAKRVSKIKSFRSVIVRRVSMYRWGIDAICKGKREAKNSGIRYWVLKLNKDIPSKKISRIDVSYEIVPIKTHLE